MKLWLRNIILMILLAGCVKEINAKRLAVEFGNKLPDLARTGYINPGRWLRRRSI